MSLRRKWILLCVLVAALVATATGLLSFDLGRRAGMELVGNPAQMAERFQKGKATFCDLDENARLYACPAIRKAVPLPGGAALLYACAPSGEAGFVSFLGIAPETKTLAIAKLLEAGFRAGPHCSKGSEEILWLKRGPWKTATLTP